MGVSGVGGVIFLYKDFVTELRSVCLGFLGVLNSIFTCAFSMIFGGSEFDEVSKK